MGRLVGNRKEANSFRNKMIWVSSPDHQLQREPYWISIHPSILIEPQVSRICVLNSTVRNLMITRCPRSWKCIMMIIHTTGKLILINLHRINRTYWGERFMRRCLREMFWVVLNLEGRTEREQLKHECRVVTSSCRLRFSFLFSRDWIKAAFNPNLSIFIAKWSLCCY